MLITAHAISIAHITQPMLQQGFQRTTLCHTAREHAAAATIIIAQLFNFSTFMRLAL